MKISPEHFSRRGIGNYAYRFTDKIAHPQKAGIRYAYIRKISSSFPPFGKISLQTLHKTDPSFDGSVLFS